MRIALLYSGFLRTWDLCWKNQCDNIWLSILNQYHTYPYLYFFTDKNPCISQECSDFMLEYKWTPLPAKPFYPDGWAPHPYQANKSPEGNVYQTLRQWQGNFVGFSIVPSDYDVYVRIRPDIKFNGPLTFQKPEPKTIYIPEGMDYRGINDQFAYGDYETMKVYFQVFENYHFLWRDKGVMFNSEAMQKANLENKGITVVRFGSPQHDLIR